MHLRLFQRHCFEVHLERIYINNRFILALDRVCVGCLEGQNSLLARCLHVIEALTEPALQAQPVAGRRHVLYVVTMLYYARVCCGRVIAIGGGCKVCLCPRSRWGPLWLLGDFRTHPTYIDGAPKKHIKIYIF